MTPETLAIARRVEMHPAFNRLTVGLRIVEPEPDTGGYGSFRVDGDEDGIWIRAADGSEWFPNDDDHSPPMSFSLWGVPDLDDAATVGVLLSQLPAPYSLNVVKGGSAKFVIRTDAGHFDGPTLGQAVAIAWLATAVAPESKPADTEEVSL